MSIKIFLPSQYFYWKQPSNLFGQLHISDDNVVVFYVVEVKNKKSKTDPEDLRYLGSICESYADSNYCSSRNMMICFTYTSESSNISLLFTGVVPEDLRQIKLILYNKQAVRDLVIKENNSVNNWKRDRIIQDDCDFYLLATLVQPEPHSKHLPMQLFMYVVGYALITKILETTVFYKHYKEWQTIYAKGTRLTNIMIDRALGIILMLFILTLASQPGDFLINISQIIISQLYALLKVLEGSPIGLKLNIHLNNFFLDCFKYHIELWSTFLITIEPIVRQVFLGIGAFGLLGFTYQIALLGDLISIVGLHAHCFYIYTKVLTEVELHTLSVLWQVVRGNRYNILRNRIEAHNFMNRQLYIATIVFSTILFLFPTTLVYYVVFATLKALTSCSLAILEFFRRILLNFPVEMFLKCLRKGFNEIDCLGLLDMPLQRQIYFTHQNYRIQIYVFKLRV